MALLDIAEKATGEYCTAAEFNALVDAVKKLQSEKGHAVYFDDQYTASVPQAITGTDYVAISNNMASKIETYLPYGSNPLYDGTKIVPPSAGAGFSAYVSFIAKSSGNSSYFDFGVDIAGDFDEIFRVTEVTVKGTNTYNHYYLPINGYMLDTFLANGGIPKIKPKTGDTISIYSSVIFVNVGYQLQ